MLALVGLQQALWILHNNTFYELVCVCVCATTARTHCVIAPFTMRLLRFSLTSASFSDNVFHWVCPPMHACMLLPHVQLLTLCCITLVVSPPPSPAEPWGPSLCKKGITAEQRLAALIIPAAPARMQPEHCSTACSRWRRLSPSVLLGLFFFFLAVLRFAGVFGITVLLNDPILAEL